MNSEAFPDTAFRLATFFPYLVRLYYRAVSQSVTAVYATNYGLTVNEWRTMAVLNDHAPLSAKDIVTRSSMDKVNVSRAVASLQKRGLLARHVNPTDRRQVLLHLTRKGRKTMDDLVPQVQAVEDRLLADLTDEERATLVRLMGKVRENAAAITSAGSRP